LHILNFFAHFVQYIKDSDSSANVCNMQNVIEQCKRSEALPVN